MYVSFIAKERSTFFFFNYLVRGIITINYAEQ